MVPFGPRFESFLPIQLYVFSDGLFVVEAAEILDPLISRDNRMAVRSKLPSFLIVPRLLEGVGIVGTGDEVEFLLEDSDGLYSAAVNTVPNADFLDWARSTTPSSRATPLCLSNLRERFWATFLEDSATVYVQYNAVTPDTQTGGTIGQFSERLRAFIAANAVESIRPNFEPSSRSMKLGFPARTHFSASRPASISMSLTDFLERFLRAPVVLSFQ